MGSLAEQSVKKSELSGRLKVLTACQQVLVYKLRTFHWNVEGLQFFAWHAFFEEQYLVLDKSLDDIAERVRALGEYVPTTLAEMLSLSDMSESQDHLTAEQMLEVLVADYQHMLVLLKQLIEETDTLGDDVTNDLLTGLMVHLEKALWMLKSTLKVT